jgi:hypothetical protein
MRCMMYFLIIYRTKPHADPSLRFLCSVFINGRELGRGVAKNKRAAKFLSAQQALNNICPTLYVEWRTTFRGDALLHESELITDNEVGIQEKSEMFE